MSPLAESKAIPKGLLPTGTDTAVSAAAGPTAKTPARAQLNAVANTTRNGRSRPRRSGVRIPTVASSVLRIMKTPSTGRRGGRLLGPPVCVRDQGRGGKDSVSYTHLRAHETRHDLV